VEIEEGVEGLVHISDLSWTKKIKHPSEITEIGAPLEVQVLEIDKENRRLSLGHKQLKENPWDVFETIFTEGSVHEGTVAELTDKGAIIALPYGVEAFASSKHLVKEDGSQAQPDEKLEFKIIEFNKDAKRIVVSHTRVSEDEQTEKTESSKRKPRRSSKKGDSETASSPIIEKTTFGDIEELAALKEKLENQKATTKKGAKKKAKAKEEKAEETIAVADEKAEKEVSEVKDNEKEVKQTETEVEMNTEAGETETTTEVKEKSDTDTTDVEAGAEEVKEETKEEAKEEVKEEVKEEAKETKAEISVETKKEAPVKKEEKEAPKEKGEAEAEAEAEETTKQEEKKDAPKEEK
jgi:small subunit ribosomal protein S1